MVTRCRASLDTVFGVSRATCLANPRTERIGLRAQQRFGPFASVEHLEFLWFMWEIREASDSANVVIVSKLTLRKCSWHGNCVCVCVCVNFRPHCTLTHTSKSQLPCKRYQLILSGAKSISVLHTLPHISPTWSLKIPPPVSVQVLAWSPAWPSLSWMSSLCFDVKAEINLLFPPGSWHVGPSVFAQWSGGFHWAGIKPQTNLAQLIVLSSSHLDPVMFCRHRSSSSSWYFLFRTLH